MKVIQTAIPDVLLIEAKVFGDSRGFFFESYNKKLFAQNNIPVDFVQDNHVLSACGVLRGLHYQLDPRAQAKLVRVLRGKIFDVAVDIRKDSPTFGQSVGVHLNAQDKLMIYVPAGFAHGYLSLEDNTEVLYKVSDVYSPQHERGIIWNDKTINVQWPVLNTDYNLSEKDKKLPSFKDANLM